MKALPEKMLDQASALGAYFDALMLSQDVAAPETPGADNAGTVAGLDATAAKPDNPPEYSGETHCTSSDEVTIRALLFEVAGLTLALPEERVSAVIAVDNAVAPAGEPAALFLGTWSHAGGRCAMVDTARVVLPADRAARLPADPAERARYLLVLDEGRWALACSRAGDVVEIDPGEARWRTAAGKRPWLAGTVSDKKCVLLDVEGLKQLLGRQMA